MSLSKICSFPFFNKKLNRIHSASGEARGDFSWEDGGNLPINLHRTYEKLLCKGEPYWFSG